MNYLFHNYYLVQPELPHLRKMHGKAPDDTPWKIPLPGHERSHRSQHQAHLEHQLMQKQGKHHKDKQEVPRPPQSTHESSHEAFEGHVSATDGCQGQALAHTGSRSSGKWWGAVAALLQEESEGLPWRGAHCIFHCSQPGFAAPLPVNLLLGPKLSGKETVFLSAYGKYQVCFQHCCSLKKWRYYV